MYSSTTTSAAHGRYSRKDLEILSSILAEAETSYSNEAFKTSDEMALMDVLNASSSVLERYAIDPSVDTFYYRCLLKMALHKEPNWWKKLELEVQAHDRKQRKENSKWKSLSYNAFSPKVTSHPKPLELQTFEDNYWLEEEPSKSIEEMNAVDYMLRIDSPATFQKDDDMHISELSEHIEFKLPMNPVPPVITSGLDTTSQVLAVRRPYHIFDDILGVFNHWAVWTIQQRRRGYQESASRQQPSPTEKLKSKNELQNKIEYSTTTSPTTISSSYLSNSLRGDYNNVKLVSVCFKAWKENLRYGYREKGIIASNHKRCILWEFWQKWNESRCSKAEEVRVTEYYIGSLLGRSLRHWILLLRQAREKERCKEQARIHFLFCIKQKFFLQWKGTYLSYRLADGCYYTHLESTFFNQWVSWTNGKTNFDLQQMRLAEAFNQKLNWRKWKHYCKEKRAMRIKQQQVQLIIAERRVFFGLSWWKIWHVGRRRKKLASRFMLQKLRKSSFTLLRRSFWLSRLQKQILSSWTRFMLLKCLSEWKRWSQIRRKLSALGHQIQETQRLRILKETFSAFRIEISTRVRINDILFMLEDTRELRYMNRGLKMWYSNHIRRIRHSLITDRLKTQSSKSALLHSWTSWRRGYESSNALKRRKAYNKSRLVGEVFESWKNLCKQLMHAEQESEKRFQKIQHFRMSELMTCWKIFTKRKKSVANASSVVARRQGQNMFNKFWLHWVSEFETSVINNEKLAAQSSRREWKALLSVFEAWRSYSKLRVELRLRQDECTLKTTFIKLRNSISKWQHFISMRQEEQAMRATAANFQWEACLSKRWSYWLLYVCNNKKKRKRKLQATEQWNRSVKQKGILYLIQGVRRVALQRNINSTADEHCRKYRLLTGARRLKKYLASRIITTSMVGKAADHYEVSQLRLAVAIWSGAAERRKRYTELIQLTMDLLLTSRVRPAFKEWANVVRNRIRLRLKLGLALEKMRSSVARTCFENWISFLALSRLSREQNRRAAEFFEASACTVALRLWKQYCTNENLVRLNVKKIMLRSRKYYFGSWKSFCIERRRIGKRISNLDALRRKYLQTCAINAWHTESVSIGKMEYVLLYYKGKTTAFFFTMWKKFMSLKYQRDLESTRKIVAVWQNQYLASVIRQWKVFRYTSQKTHALELIKSRVLRQDALSYWKLDCKYQRATVAYSTQLTKRSFNNWKALLVMEKDQRVSLNCVFMSIARRILRRSLQSLKNFPIIDKLVRDRCPRTVLLTASFANWISFTARKATMRRTDSLISEMAQSQENAWLWSEMEKRLKADIGSERLVEKKHEKIIKLAWNAFIENLRRAKEYRALQQDFILRCHDQGAVARAVVTRWKNPLELDTFKAWRRITQEVIKFRKIVTMCKEKARVRMLNESISDWIQFCLWSRAYRNSVKVWEMSHKAKHFYSWQREFLPEKLKQDYNHDRALGFNRFRVIRKIFVAWIDHLMLLKSLEVEANRKFDAITVMQRRTILHCWRHVVIKKHAFKLQMVEATLHFNVKTLQSSFSLWQGYAVSSLRAKERLLQLTERLQHLLLASHMRAWIEWSQRRKETKLIAKAIEENAREVLMIRSLFYWRKRLREQQEKQNKAYHFAVTTLQRKALDEWKRVFPEMQLKRMNNELARRHKVSHFLEKTMPRVCAAWRNWTLSRLYKKRRVAESEEYWDRVCLYKGLTGLSINLEKRRIATCMSQIALSFNTDLLQKHYFFAVKDYILERKLTARAKLHWESQFCSKYMFKWQRYLVLKHREASKICAIQKASECNTMNYVLNRWWFKFHCHARGRSIIRKRVWHKWVKLHRKLKAIAKTSNIVATKHVQVLKLHFVSFWIDFVEEKTLCKLRRQTADMFLLKMRCRSSFAPWKSFTRQKVEFKLKSAVILRRMIFFSQSRSFMSWKLFAIRKRKASMFLSALNAKRMTSAIEELHVYAKQSAKHRREALVAKNHLYTKLWAKYFTAWRVFTKFKIDLDRRYNEFRVARQERILRTAFHETLSRVQYIKSKRTKYKMAVTFHNNYVEKTIFLSWCGGRRSLRAWRFYDQHLQKRFFKHWFAYKVLKRASDILRSRDEPQLRYLVHVWKKFKIFVQNVNSRGDRAIKKRQVHGRFIRWRNFYTRMKKLHKISDHVAKDVSLKLQKVAWNEWKKNANALRHRHRHLLRIYLVPLSKHALKRRSKKIEAKKHRHFLDRCILRRLLRAWLKDIELSKTCIGALAREGQVIRKVHTFRVKRNQRLLLENFNNWRERIDSNLRVRATVIKYANVKLLSRYWVLWGRFKARVHIEFLQEAYVKKAAPVSIKRRFWRILAKFRVQSIAKQKSMEKGLLFFKKKKCGLALSRWSCKSRTRVSQHKFDKQAKTFHCHKWILYWLNRAHKRKLNFLKVEAKRNERRLKFLRACFTAWKADCNVCLKLRAKFSRVFYLADKQLEVLSIQLWKEFLILYQKKRALECVWNKILARESIQKWKMCCIEDRAVSYCRQTQLEKSFFGWKECQLHELAVRHLNQRRNAALVSSVKHWSNLVQDGISQEKLISHTQKRLTALRTFQAIVRWKKSTALTKKMTAAMRYANKMRIQKVWSSWASVTNYLSHSREVLYETISRNIELSLSRRCWIHWCDNAESWIRARKSHELTIARVRLRKKHCYWRKILREWRIISRLLRAYSQLETKHQKNQLQRQVRKWHSASCDIRFYKNQERMAKAHYKSRLQDRMFFQWRIWTFSRNWHTKPDLTLEINAATAESTTTSSVFKLMCDGLVGQAAAATRDIAGSGQGGVTVELRTTEFRSERKVICFLGISNCGKSTWFKNLRTYCRQVSDTDEDYYEHELYDYYKKMIYTTVLEHLQDICEEIQMSTEEEGEEFLPEEVSTLMEMDSKSISVDDFEEDEEQLNVFRKIAFSLEFQEAHAQEAHNLPPNILHLFDNIERILSSDYQPSDTDMMLEEGPTEVMLRSDVQYEGLELTLVDTIGHRNCRLSNAAVSQIGVIVFVADISGYDTGLEEAPRRNSMKETLLAFKRIACDPHRNAPVLVLFNKLDLFSTKSSVVDLNYCFPQYEDGFDECKAHLFIEERFREASGDRSDIRYMRVSGTKSSKSSYVMQEIKTALEASVSRAGSFT